MEIICPKCRNQRTIDEKLIPPNVKSVLCKVCGHRFPLKAEGDNDGLDKLVQAVEHPEPSESARHESEPGRCRSIGVLLSKGGVGKTTTSVNLAAGLALAGYRVLLIDTDTQGQSAYMLGVKPKAGLTELVTEELPPEEAIVQARDRLWLLAGGKSLAGIKRLIDRKDFGGEMTIAEAITPLEKDYDFVVVDSSPGWDPLTVNVLFYVKEILAPVALEVMSLQGLLEFFKSLAAIKKYNRDINLKYILPTFLDKRVKNPGDLLIKLEQLYPKYICTPIRYNVRLSEAPAYGMSIFEYAPGSHGALDYRELVRKVSGNDKLFR